MLRFPLILPRSTNIGTRLSICRSLSYDLKTPQPPEKANKFPSAAYFVSKLPSKKLQAYARLSRMQAPIGTYLLFLPCGISIALSGAPLVTQLYYDSIMLFGAFCMRGVGCIRNDYADQDIDKQVERTKIRPLASGELSSSDAKKSALLHLMGAVSTLPLINSVTSDPINLSCLGLAVASLPLVYLYPKAKRFTYCPQLVLGATFSWGAFMGMTAITGGNFINTLNITAPLYLGCLLWTIYYDTIYAFQDLNDDFTSGVKSYTFPVLDLKEEHQINNNEEITKLEDRKSLLTDEMLKRKVNLGQIIAANKLFNIRMTSNLFIAIAINEAGFDIFYNMCYLIPATMYAHITCKRANFKDAEGCWRIFNREKYVMAFLMGILMFGSVVDHGGINKKEVTL